MQSPGRSQLDFGRSLPPERVPRRARASPDRVAAMSIRARLAGRLGYMAHGQNGISPGLDTPDRGLVFSPRFPRPEANILQLAAAPFVPRAAPLDVALPPFCRPGRRHARRVDDRWRGRPGHSGRTGAVAQAAEPLAALVPHTHVVFNKMEDQGQPKARSADRRDGHSSASVTRCWCRPSPKRSPPWPSDVQIAAS